MTIRPTSGVRGSAVRIGLSRRNLRRPLRRPGRCSGVRRRHPTAVSTACGKTNAAFDGRCIPAEPPRFAGLCVALRSKYTRYSSLARLVSRAPHPSRRSRGFHHRLLTLLAGAGAMALPLCAGCGAPPRQAATGQAATGRPNWASRDRAGRNRASRDRAGRNWAARRGEPGARHEVRLRCPSRRDRSRWRHAPEPEGTRSRDHRLRGDHPRLAGA